MIRRLILNWKLNRALAERKRLRVAGYVRLHRRASLTNEDLLKHFGKVKSEPKRRSKLLNFDTLFGVRAEKCTFSLVAKSKVCP